MKAKKGIRQKLTRLILIISIVSLVAVTCTSVISMVNMSQRALETASQDAIEQLKELAQSRAEIADSMLLLAQNHTLLVAEGAKEILTNADQYLLGYNEQSLPDVVCTDKYADKIGKYSVHVRVPEGLLKNIQKDDTDTVVSAEIDREAKLSSNLTVNQELYLASLLSNEFAQIERFKNEEGNYTGFAASYFCFDDSGLDVLGDPLTAPMVSYDGRERAWYTGAVEGFKNGTLTKSGVYWTDPVQDGSGRGISMICAVPVMDGDKVLGVAGSGGLLVNFAELVESSTVGETGYSFMMSRNTSKVIINPNTSEKEAEQSEVMIETDLSQSSNTALAAVAARVSAGEQSGFETLTIDGVESYLAFSALQNNDWVMMTIISCDDGLIMDSYNSLNNQMVSAFVVFFVLILIVILAVIFISARFSKTFTKPIIELKNGVDKIGEGNLDYVLDIKTGDEIEDLGTAFNGMASNLDQYIKNLAAMTAEKERIGAELDVATHIQASMLPCIFPAFPDRDEFDIYATMTPAKEVGGDFYDFFMLDEKHVAIVMADVSGKGVPAALFMVIAKTLIKDHSYPFDDLGRVFANVNKLLCESNEGGMFVTAFEGVLDLETGEFNYVNAGHEMPFIYKPGQGYAPQKIKAGFVLAGMEGMLYKAGSFQLEPGDKIFQYTDGVTEATNAQNKLYGMEKLEKVLNDNADKTCSELLPAIKADIDEFVGEAPQFDDITMLCLEYKKKYTPKEQVEE